MNSDMRSQIFGFVKNFLINSQQQNNDFKINQNYNLVYQSLPISNLNNYLEQKPYDKPINYEYPLPLGPVPQMPQQPFSPSLTDFQNNLGSLNPLPKIEGQPFLVGKRISGQYSLNKKKSEHPFFVNVNVTMTDEHKSCVCLKKVKTDFEEIMRKIQKESKSHIKVNFQNCSISTMSSPPKIEDGLRKKEEMLEHSEPTSIFGTKASQISKRSKDKIVKEFGKAHIDESTKCNPASTELAIDCFIRSIYFGNTDPETSEDRQKTLSKLLQNISKTFQFENNLSTTIKNLITFENLQIRVNKDQFKQLSFQVKITLFFRYWFHLIDYNWFKISFENVSPKLKITKPSFISEISKE